MNLRSYRLSFAFNRQSTIQTNDLTACHGFKKTLLGSCGFCVLVLNQSSYTGCLFIDMSESRYTFPFLGTNMGLIILVVYK